MLNSHVVPEQHKEREKAYNTVRYYDKLWLFNFYITFC